MSKVFGAWGGVQCGWGDGELGGEVKMRLVRSEGWMVKGLTCMTIMMDSSVHRPSHELETEDAQAAQPVRGQASSGGPGS